MHADIATGEQDAGRFLTLAAFLGKYGFDIDIDPGIEKQVHAVMQSPGSYYAIGHTGVLVVSPQARLVIYMYAG